MLDEKTVLFVDDEKNILNSLRRQMAFYDFKVLVANSANDALAILAETKVPVIVSDQRMPDISGSKFLAEVRMRYPETVRMIMSGYSDFSAIQEAINEGEIYKFILKPWQEDSLVNDLNQAFDHFQATFERIAAPLQKVDTNIHPSASEYTAMIDSETHTFNQLGFEAQLKSLLAKREEADADIFVFALYFDKFTSFINTMGQSVSQQLALIFTQKLKHFQPALLGRLKPNIFAFTIDFSSPSPESLNQFIVDLIDTLRAEFAEPFEFEGKKYLFKPYIGVSSSLFERENARMLLEEATISAEYGSLNKKDYVFYSPVVDKEAKQDLHLESSVLEIIGSSGFELFYQPQILALSGEIVGFEALTRIHQIQNPFFSVQDFIEKAEKMDIIDIIESQVILEAIRQSQKLQAIFKRSFKMSINISPVHLMSGKVLENAKTALEKTGVNPENLVFEITEGVCLKDLELTQQYIAEIKALGIQIALDDFGTGYATVNYLTKLPFDIIKIDKSLLEDIDFSAKNATLLKHTIDLCKALDCEVIVEGLETVEELKVIQTFGVDILQGYYFAKPLDVSALEQFVMSHQPIQKAN